MTAVGASRAVTKGAEAKSLPEQVNELRELVVGYAKQETLEPIKGLGRFVAFGMAGSMALCLGLVVLVVAGLRALQTETGTTFTGNLTWVPYAAGAGAALVVLVLAAMSVGRRRDKRYQHSRSS